MKKWKSYTPQEKRMILILIALILAVVLSWGRIGRGLEKGRAIFSGSPAGTTGTTE